MRKTATRATALLLAALLTAAPAASASQALGTQVHYSTAQLAQGVFYTQQYLWSATYSDLRTERFLEYFPNELVQPAVAYGEKVLNKQTLTALAQSLEADGKRVLGGVNGDYFVMATGAPLGMVVTDGVLRSSSSYLYALGFDANGRAFTGKPELAISATFGGLSYNVYGGLNKVRTRDDGYFLYTSDFAATTEHTAAGVDVILAPSQELLGQTVSVQAGDGSVRTLTYSNVPKIGSRVSCTVEQVLQSAGAIEIPEGRLVLTIHGGGNADLIAQLSALKPGSAVELDFTCQDTRWESAVTAIGGLYKMVTNGAVEPGLADTETAQAPRTAVGVRLDGSAVFYTVDGRQSGYSVGASMEQVAQRLVELGCVEAICLDGGGSTTLGTTPAGGGAFQVENSPSDGSQRAVSNALFLVADSAPVGEARSLVLSPDNIVVLPGVSGTFTATAVDAIGQLVEQIPAEQLEFYVSDGGGEVADGVFTAGGRAGSFVVEAAAAGPDGDLTGQAVVTVVPDPDRVTVSNETTGAAVASLSLRPGETVELTASARYRNLSVAGGDERYAWSVAGDLASVDADGTLTAGASSGSGTLTVAAGATSVSIPLTVANHITAVEDFEGEFLHTADSLTAQIAPERRSAYVRYGRQSAAITYDLDGSDYAAVNLPLSFTEGENYLSLWVYGDGSGNTLSAPVRTEDGAPNDLILAVLNFTGWQQIITPLPVGADQILMLKILPTGNAGLGTIWLDHVTTSCEYTPDATPPTVSIAYSEDAVRASIQDDVDREFEAGQVSVTFDGRELPFTLNGDQVAAALPERDGAAHRVTVTVTDASGNIGRASADVAPDSDHGQPFDDMDGHWAAEYVGYLYDQGITNGTGNEEKLLFQPEKDISRGEFALMLARWLRLDLTQYESAALPFADADGVPEWCLDAVKAMVDLGIMQGSAEIDDMYIYAQNPITRIEAMTMLGRVQAKGFESAGLTFSDVDSIPSWGLEYAETMAAQGVIQGYDVGNLLAPGDPITRCQMAKILYTMR